MHYNILFNQAVDIADRSVVLGSRTAREKAIEAVSKGQEYVIWLDVEGKKVKTAASDKISVFINQELSNSTVLYSSPDDVPKEDQLARDAHGYFYTITYGNTLQEQILATEVGTAESARKFRLELYRCDSSNNYERFPCDEIDVECFAFSENTVIICASAFISTYLRKKLQIRERDLKTRESLYIKLLEYDFINNRWDNSVPTVIHEKDEYGRDYDGYGYLFWYKQCYYEPYFYISDGIYGIPGHIVMPADKPNTYNLDEEKTEPVLAKDWYLNEIKFYEKEIEEAVEKRKDLYKRQKKSASSEVKDEISSYTKKLKFYRKELDRYKMELENGYADVDGYYGNSKLFPIIEAMQKELYE